MKRFEGKTVVISGAARGQGRSHALGFAAEGANVVGFDICGPVESTPIALASPDDLAETAGKVEALGSEALFVQADVRDAAQVADVFRRARDRFGHIDVVLANAGIIGHFAPSWEIDDDTYRDVVDIDLIGAWRVLKYGVAAMIEDGVRGVVTVTGSGASLKGLANLSPYVAAKHGLVGMVRTAARELGAHGIRVNLIAPGNVNTDMIINPFVYGVYFPGVDSPSKEDFEALATSQNPMGQPYLEPDDITRTVLYLSSDDARFVTGTVVPVDGGQGIP
ncbi:mycofactocin-coupled SDR family oxidoreductase [Amycolatopsis pithecellobii]|uniref:mycofactocin-coupled SDR family oxidoreductase n=1 Tax=Amycolatopsis pithecellobii TaxID=664692 RepID=UPI0012BA0AF8|nr:mycofactocin-coupled SDR family oxidoreductase [Amycolatopsis pithecellobii]